MADSSKSKMKDPVLKLSDQIIDSLIYAVECTDKHKRSEIVKEKFSNFDKPELLKVIDGLISLGCDYAASCDETIFLHLVTEGDLHPHEVEKLNAPSFLGAVKGIRIAKNAPKQAILCESCAYRCGTLANHSIHTQHDLAHAKDCEAVFYCHKDIENLNCPSEKDKRRMRPCRGWAQEVKAANNDK